MKEQIHQSVEEVLRQASTALADAFEESIRELSALVRLDDYHRHGYDPDQLEQALGPLAATNMNIGSLSRVLGESKHSRAMTPERLRRVEELIKTLGEMKEALATRLLTSAAAEIETDEQEILALAEEHFNRFARVFRTVRIAQLELRGKYDSRIHDRVCTSFTWRQLSPAELRSCPPFLVMARLDGDSGPQLRKVMTLLQSGMPIKVAALRSRLRDVHSTSVDAGVPCTMTMETLPLALRGVYFVQTCVAASDFEKQLFEGLTAPRPGVISVLCQRDDEEQSAFQARAERAVRARAFPICIYDPDRDERFVLCFDLSSNPSPDTLWSHDTLSASDVQGQAVENEEPFTFAHFAAFESEFSEELSDAPANADNLVSLTDYLELTRRQRVEKLPFISLAGNDGSIVRKVVSTTLAAQCLERLHLWRTLQEISGIDNPHVSISAKTLQKELGAQQRAELDALRRQMEDDAARREHAATAAAIRKLVAHLTGIEPPGQP
ncbi:MAG: hypothetical protein KJO40_09425 [Deltaproteobacteria bacterium]|nr:hypothetical protein [Deltaproteobacteria bacterium]MBT8481437.1 hypothetical protein [Deltaproteobacteria bacterium]NNL24300.1 hypothetical protein [Myxococcales bacterium]